MTIRGLFRRHTAGAIAVLSLLLGAASAFGLTEAGQIIALAGRVVATNANQAERELALRSPVYVGDHIRSFRGARAQVFLLDDTTISLGEESYMVIDAFVYEAKPKEDVSSLRFLRGVIRNVTGRITQANPSRFQVKTGKAVIGVRGCDILFDVQPEVEQIHVLEVPPKRQIIVDADYRPRNKPDLHIQKRHEIKRAGRTVQLFDTGETRQLATPPSEIQHLMRRLGPPPEDDSMPDPNPAGQQDDPNPDPTDPGAQETGEATDPSPMPSVNPATPQDSQTDEVIVDRPVTPQDIFASPPDPFSSSSMPSSTSGPNSNLDPSFGPTPELDPTPSPVPDPSPTPDPGPDPDPDPGPGPGPGPDPDPAPDPDPGPNPDPGQNPDHLVQQLKASGTDWEWGIWETSLDHTPKSFYANVNALTPNEISSIMVGATKYHLQGIGLAGAIVYQEGAPNVYIQGAADFYIAIGQSWGPAWSAVFSLGMGGPVSLAFNVDGSIGPDRVLHGQVRPTQADYALTIPGGVFYGDTLAVNQVNGVLVGNSSLANPITGVVGNFQFRHGPTGPKLDGVYGTDLGVVSQW